MRNRVFAVIVALVGNSPSLASGRLSSQPAASSRPVTAAPCVGSLREYCQPKGGQCPTYAERVEQWKSHCKQPDAPRVVAHRCAGVYSSLSWRQPTLLFGSDEYFDTTGRLVAAYVISDALGAHCSGSSPSRTFGSIPTCPTERIIVDLCKTSDGV